MNACTYPIPADFLARARAFLEVHEAVNGLILGIAIRLVERPEWIERQPFLGSVEDETGQLALAAAITPPFNLLLAADPALAEPDLARAADALAGALREGGWPFPGVNAEERAARLFVERWSRASGQAYREKMRLRLFELREVIPPPNPPVGRLRAAEARDLEIVAAWKEAFALEALGKPDPEGGKKAARRRIESGDTFLWEDIRPVSMALRTRPTPNGVSIGGVYTPPELRGRGYASACVAALSQHLLDSGKQFTSLFTDLANPTSNSIYQKIGYRPLNDFTEYELL